MSGLGRAFGFGILLSGAASASQHRHPDEWRELHRRPDAKPLPDRDQVLPAQPSLPRRSLGRLLAGEAE
jgi:hypothetical protein